MGSSSSSSKSVGGSSNSSSYSTSSKSASSSYNSPMSSTQKPSSSSYSNKQYYSSTSPSFNSPPSSQSQSMETNSTQSFMKQINIKKSYNVPDFGFILTFKGETTSSQKQSDIIERMMLPPIEDNLSKTLKFKFFNPVEITEPARDNNNRIVFNMKSSTDNDPFIKLEAQVEFTRSDEINLNVVEKYDEGGGPGVKMYVVEVEGVGRD